MEGSGTGAKSGEWLDGNGCPPGFRDSATSCGSSVPMKKYIDGTPAFTNSEKSSLAVIGGHRFTFPLPRAERRRGSVRVTTTSLFTTAGAPSPVLTSGSGAPAIAAAALAVRVTPASSLALTSGLYERMVPLKVTVS